MHRTSLITMSNTGTKGMVHSNRIRIFAVVAVLLMVFSAFAVVSDRSSVASAEPAVQDCLETDVVYHAADSALTVNASYNEQTAYTTTRSFTYYGTVISTEYNPQVWEFSGPGERWFRLAKDASGNEKYEVGTTYVFTGWKFATAGTVTAGVFTPSAFTTTYDPGDIILYDSSDNHWYVDSQQVDLDVDDGKIHIYATWGLLAHIDTNPSVAVTWTDGSKFQDIAVFTGNIMIKNIMDNITSSYGYTMRAANIDNVAASVFVDTDVNNYKLTCPVIIDNLSMEFKSGKAGNYVDINADSNIFIIGTGINSIKTSGRDSYGHYGTIHGGINGDTKMIVHSGTFSNIFGGGKKNSKSVVIMNGGVVLDTLSGGNPTNGTYQVESGDLYLYLTGVTMYSDTYTDYLINHQHDGTKVTGTGNLPVIESSMIIGGNASRRANSTNLYLTGTSDVWAIQAAGRAGGSNITHDANMEISGRAVVRNIACGGTTDALSGGSQPSSLVEGNINIHVRDAPYIASLAGGGYDTYDTSKWACFLGSNRSINVTIDGGTIGYVYGGGLRGPIGTASQPTNININMNGGEVLRDIYGGGSGTLVKIKHSNTSGDIVTKNNNACKDPTGIPYVYGTVTINMTGGIVDGSVYGGGKSVAAVNYYGGYNEGNPFSDYRELVAMVVGTITVNVSGGMVNGNVFGAGKGLDTSSLGLGSTDKQDAVGNENSSLYVIRNKTAAISPALKNPDNMVQSDLSMSSDLELAYIPWARQNLNSNDKVQVTFKDLRNPSDSEKSYYEFARVTGNTAVNISGDCVIQGSVYGGGQIGKLYGGTAVHITGGTVMAMVYGGGLGVLDRMSVRDNRKITVGGRANIVGSIYGGSALGTDGVDSSLASDVYIYIKAGTIGGSIFGGGFQGTTYGDVFMFVGVDSLDMGDSSQLIADTEPETAVDIGGSVYLGGDVGVLTNSGEAFTKYMVRGGGQLFMAQGPLSNNLSFTGTIMGSGNSCLTSGETTIHLKHITTFSSNAAEAIHRATNVILEGCVLELNGRATVENSLDNVVDTDYTLYRIEHLTLTDGTTLVLNSSINYIYELNSENSHGDPTTPTSPLNKIVVGGGNLFVLKSIEWTGQTTYTEAYGVVNGFTILAARSNEQQYGVMALGDPDSEGGFVVLKSGTFEKADHSDLTEDCRCWYLAGAINNEATLTVAHDSYDIVKVDMPSLQSGSSYRYTGGTFIPNSPGDANSISTDEAVLEGQFQVRFGCYDNTTNCLVFADDEAHPENGAIMRNDLGQGDPILGLKKGGASVRNPYMVIEVTNMISEFKYVGYAIICVNEVVAISLPDDSKAYIVVNSIQTKIHIYTADKQFGGDTDLDISIVEGAGSSTFLVPSGMAGANFVIDSVTPVDGASGVSAFSVTAVKNMNSTPGWTDNLGTFVLRTDGSVSSTVIGTLQGGYNASLRIDVNLFTSSGLESYDFAVRIVKDGVNVKSFTLTVNVSRTPNVSVIFHVNETTQLKYTYPYNTSITLPDCPPTDDNFVGWYTDPSYNNPYTFTFPLIRDMDLYARYMYEVTMDYMDGTSSVVYVAMPSGYIGTMADPVRDGYIFGGWYTDTEYNDYWDLATDEVTESMTLYAHWVGWDVKVRFQVDFGAGPVNVYLDPSKAQHHTGDIIDCQIMEFGTKFNTYDTFTTSGGETSMSLLEWAQYNLELMPAYSAGGYKFIYWTFQVIDSSGKAVPVYTDSYLEETIRLLTDEEGYAKEDGYYVVVLTAKVAKVALKVDMDSAVIVEGQSVDNLALVDPPSSFLIFPYQEVEDSYYDMKIELNGATRPGYSLKGWSIADPTDGSAEFVRDEPYLYAAGTNIILHIYKNTGGDKATYPWIAQFKISGETAETMKITELGRQRMFGEVTENLTIKFQSKWERIPYSVSIADPPHGTIVAIYDDDGTPIQFDDATFFYGDSVTLVFTPDAGYNFHHWYSSGEGLFSAEYSEATTFVVQGDTNISAYLVGPQIVRVYIEYDGLYNEIGVDGKVHDGSTEYTVKAVNTSVLSTANNIRFIVTGAGNHVTVISVPYGVTVHVNDVLRVEETDYTVDAVKEVLQDAEKGAKFIVTDDVNHYATVVAYYIDESIIPNLYWKNGDDKVYFTESVYIADMGTNDRSLIQYIGTAILGTHDIYLEGRSFDREYKLGMPITSTTLQNVYYIMTPKELYSMATIPAGAQTGHDGTQNVDFAVTDPSEDGATISKVYNNTQVITIGDTVSGGGTFNVIGIAPDAVLTCTSMEFLVIHGDTIYRYGYISVYTNGILNHVTDPSSQEIAGVGSGIATMKEYVLNYYLDDNPDGVDASTDVTITLEPGYYYYNYPNDSTHVDHSLDTEKVVTIAAGYITKKVVLGTITRAHYTIDIYYGKGSPEASGSPVTITDVFYGDSYLEVLNPHKAVPTTSYEVYAWYTLSGSPALISSEMFVISDPDVTIEVFGEYIESAQKTTIWLRTELLNGTYSVSNPETVVYDGHVHYCVDSRSGYSAAYDFDDGTVVTASYLETKVYPSSTPVTENPIDVVPGTGNVVIITYYRAVVNVTIYDAEHLGTTQQYVYGQTVVLVHSTDTADRHYDGWTRNGSPITVPAEGYAITLADVTVRNITLRETWTVREYTVNVVTSLAEIHEGVINHGKAVSLSIPYNTAVSVSGTYNTVLTIGDTAYALTGYMSYKDYYDLSQGDWVGIPAGGHITGDTVISYNWVANTYTLRIVYDQTVTVSGTEGTEPMLFNDVVFSVSDVKTTYTVDSGDLEGVQFIVTDDVNDYATVIYIPDGKTVHKNETFSYDEVTYTVTEINTTVKETSLGIKFIITDWANKEAVITDLNGQPAPLTVTQDGPNHTVTVAPGPLGYGSIIRLTMVFTGSYTLDEKKSSYVNPAEGGTYALNPAKQSSLQEWIVQFFVSGDMEITIKSKWVGEHVTFFIRGTEGGNPMIDPSLTLLVAQGEPLYINITDYEWISRLDVPGYYFDGWYTNTDFTRMPEIAFSDGHYCFKIVGNTSLYARYVPLVKNTYDLEYNGTEQFVDVNPQINVPLNVSDVGYTYEGGSATSIYITDVDDDINHKAITYTFTPRKVYTYIVDDETRYVMSGVNHAYTGLFTLELHPRPVIVIADSQTKVYDGTELVCDSYSVFGLKGGSLITEHSKISYSGKITQPGTVTCTVNITDPSSNYSVTYYRGTLMVIGKTAPKVTSETSVEDIRLTGTGPITISYGSSSVTIRQGDVTKSVSGRNASIVLEDVTVAAASGPAVSIGDGCNITLIIEGTCSLTGAAGYDGIRVGTNATLLLTGTGTLTVTGNAGSDASGGGSGIGYAGSTPGAITIRQIAGLDAYGYGTLAYGIGGTGASVTIDDSTLGTVRGGISGGDVADRDREGGPGIGGLTVTITKSTITSVTGGSNAAGIGSIRYAPATVTITTSNIGSVTGGSYSAGIGGGAQAEDDGTQKIKISIVRSTVTAAGGIYGAAIGSGYDAFAEAQGLCLITITDDSKITATGGKYAASIGTGYRHANLTGYIDGSCMITLPERSESDMVKSDSPTFYGAQYVGYGVTDPAAEAAGLQVYFYRALSPIPAPSVPEVEP